VLDENGGKAVGKVCRNLRKFPQSSLNATRKVSISEVIGAWRGKDDGIKARAGVDVREPERRPEAKNDKGGKKKNKRGKGAWRQAKKRKSRKSRKKKWPRRATCKKLVYDT